MAVDTHTCPYFLLFTIMPPPRPTLFPYTTLFRSRGRRTQHIICFHRPASARAARRPCRANTPDRGCPRCSPAARSEEHTSELQSLRHLVCRLLLEKKK